MATSKLALLESRIATLEADLAELKHQSPGKTVLPGDDWVDKIYGAFADDPDYDKAMALGRQYREAQRPQKAKKGAVSVTTSRPHKHQNGSAFKPKTHKKGGVKVTTQRKP